MLMIIVIGERIGEKVHSSHIRFKHFKMYKNHKEWYKELTFSEMIQNGGSTKPVSFISSSLS